MQLVSLLGSYYPYLVRSYGRVRLTPCVSSNNNTRPSMNRSYSRRLHCWRCHALSLPSLFQRSWPRGDVSAITPADL